MAEFDTEGNIIVMISANDNEIVAFYVMILYSQLYWQNATETGSVIFVMFIL